MSPIYSNLQRHLQISVHYILLHTCIARVNITVKTEITQNEPKYLRGGMQRFKILL